VVAVPILGDDGQSLGIVIASSSVARTAQVLTSLNRIYLTISIITVLVSVLVMSILARRLNKPIRQLRKAAVDFGHGKLDARVNVAGKSPVEIQELALAFNNMAESLQKSEDQRQDFVANVSHELKTPMTTIAGFADGILDGTIPPERQEHYLKLISQETKRLNRLVRSMLDISRLQEQGGIPEEQKTRFDVSEWAGQTLLTFEQKITSKNLQVEVQLPDRPVYTMANLDYITQVLYNLLDNAVKFCPTEGLLELSVRTGGGKIYIGVANNGQVIPQEELPLVFERFHKLDKSRSENRDSWGLGLYIVKTIVGHHGEDISVTSHDGRTEFVFTLPLVN
jgi:signal transduction histidine kinase